MSESLVIQLRDGATPQWLVCSADGKVVVNRVSGTLEQAAQLAVGRRVAVIVPSVDALATDCEAPAKGSAKLAQVVPFALEERVADEIENLHFALGERSPETGRVPVVVVERGRIDAWLAELRAAGLQPQAIYSAATLLPSMPGQLIAMLEDETITLRGPDGPPLVFPSSSITDAIDMGLGQLTTTVAGLEPAAPGLLLYAGQDEWHAHQAEIDGLRERFTGVKVQVLSHGSLGLLAPAAAAGDAINLLQGPLAVASPLEMSWKAWRIAAILAGALLFLHLGSRYFELTRLNKSEAALDASIEDAFRQAMPGQMNATNARRRVENRLADIRGGSGSGTLLPALAAVANARSAAPSAVIEGLTFRPDGTLDLRIRAPDGSSIDAIGQQLREANWQAKNEGGSNNGDSYSGRLQVRKAGS
jgi:general secretion pathway protein L